MTLYLNVDHLNLSFIIVHLFFFFLMEFIFNFINTIRKKVLSVFSVHLPYIYLYACLYIYIYVTLEEMIRF